MSQEDIMHSMATKVNNTVLVYLKIAKRTNLKVLIKLDFICKIVSIGKGGFKNTQPQDIFFLQKKKIHTSIMSKLSFNEQITIWSSEKI